MAITPPAPEDPFGALQPPSLRSRLAPLLVGLAVLVLAGGAVAAVLFLANGGPDEVPVADQPAVAVETPLFDPEVPVAPADVPPAPAQPGAAQGLGDGGSLWKPANLAVALREMRAAAEGAGRISSLRVATDYLVAEYMRGKERVAVYASRDGRVQAQSTRIGSPTDVGVAVGRVDPAVPDRLRRGIARLGRARPENVDYVVLSMFAGEAQWIGFLDAESDYDVQLNPFFARLDGSGLRANGPRARR